MNLGHKEDVVRQDKSVHHAARLSLASLLADLDEQWPSVKFLGFGAYYAWIFLCYNSSVVFGGPETSTSSSAILDMYLISTAALSVVLVIAGFFEKTVKRLIESRACVLGMAVVAMFATLLVAWASTQGLDNPLFFIGGALTGVGTAFVALRLGSVYSQVDARQAFMYTCGSFIFAGMLYFVCIGIPQQAGLSLVSVLPLIAAAFTMAAVRRPDPFEGDVVPSRELPRGYFARLVVAVAVISVITGVVKGIMAISQPLYAAQDQGIIIVFATGIVAVLLFLFVGLLARDFDISLLYYPVIILACFGNLVVPLFGGVGYIQAECVSIAYNLFILVAWCLFANVANRTDLSYVRVFGWGRGASAAGTTIGWFVGSTLAPLLVDNASNMVALSMAMVFVLMVVAMVVLSESTISRALRKTRNAASNARTGDFFPNGLVSSDDTNAVDAEKEGLGRKGVWTQSCNAIAEEAGLSARERDVLFLLGKGRTIEYVANDLGISFNTAKSHIRNVYAKTNVHSKQELQALIEGRCNDEA